MQRRETNAPTPSLYEPERTPSTETLPRGSRNLIWMRIIKTSVMLLFLCGLVGAFIYAVNSGDKSSSTDQKKGLKNTDPYSVYKTQYSEDGRYVFEIITPNFDRLAYNGSSFWYQNDERQTLLYKMDNATVVWVFEERSFWVTVDGSGQSLSCKEDVSVGYKEHIRQLSLTSMYNRHSEKRQMRGKIGVYVFEGEPVRWQRRNVVPYLTQAFAAIDDGRLIEYQSHYNMDTNNGWFSLGYTFYDMKAKEPPEHIFSNLPNNCEPASA